MTNKTDTPKKTLPLRATVNTVTKTRVDVAKIRTNNEKQTDKENRRNEQALLGGKKVNKKVSYADKIRQINDEDDRKLLEIQQKEKKEEERIRNQAVELARKRRENLGSRLQQEAEERNQDV